MRRIIALLTVITCIFALLCACKAQKAQLSSDPAKETFSGSSDKENDKNNDGEQPAPNENDGENADADAPTVPKNEYVQPTTFAKAYSNVSTLRNTFYDILSTSLTAVGESSQVLIDTYEVMSGESSFVVISACGGGSDDIIKTSLSASGYKDVNIEKSEKGEYNISLKVSVADMTSEDELFTDGSFYVYYDAEKDSFTCEYTISGIGTEKFSAKRIEGGYLAQYLSPSGKYLRFILMDDYTGKALIYGQSHWKADLPDSKEGFDIDGDITFYEITDSKFHAIHNGVEYTFHKVLPEGLVDKE